MDLVRRHGDKLFVAVATHVEPCGSYVQVAVVNAAKLVYYEDARKLFVQTTGLIAKADAKKVVPRLS